VGGGGGGGGVRRRGGGGRTVNPEGGGEQVYVVLYKARVGEEARESRAGTGGGGGKQNRDRTRARADLGTESISPLRSATVYLEKSAKVLEPRDPSSKENKESSPIRLGGGGGAIDGVG